jgi:hypothetical protein
MSAADNREALAVRKAVEAFCETLKRELAGLASVDLTELDNSCHQHMSLLFAEQKTFVVSTRLIVSSNPELVQLALESAARPHA